VICGGSKRFYGEKYKSMEKIVIREITADLRSWGFFERV